jgi:hypothetical protein
MQSAGELHPDYPVAVVEGKALANTATNKLKHGSAKAAVHNRSKPGRAFIFIWGTALTGLNEPGGAKTAKGQTTDSKTGGMP